MKSELLYTYHLDEETYPYWVGISGIQLSSFSRIPEIWCETFTRHGYDYYQTHDSFNGNHLRFLFLARVDAIRFILDHSFEDKHLSE